MSLITKILVGIVALEHIYILWLEMFAWTTTGRKVFKSLPQDLFEPTKVMAANQGLYNGFLAAGLIWALFIADYEWSVNIATFFLLCVIVAAAYGGYSVHSRIFFTQGGPAILALIVLYVLG